MLIKNFDFNKAPSFTAVQTADNWIDGTAAGSASNNSYWWYCSVRATSVSCRFDPTITHGDSAYSLKLSTTDTTGRIRVFNCLAPTGSITADVTNVPFFIPITSGGTYTFSAYCQTNNVAVNGAFIELVEFDGSFAQGVATSSNQLSGTNSSWTLLTLTVTVASTCKYIAIDMQNSVAGNVSDAWFSSLNLIGPHEQKIQFSNIRPRPFAPGLAR